MYIGVYAGLVLQDFLSIPKRLQCVYQGSKSQDDVSLDGWPQYAGLGCPPDLSA